jgi:hypothetical protein
VRIAEPHRLVSEPSHCCFEQLDGRLGLVLGVEIGRRAGPRRVRPEQIEDQSETKTLHGGRIPIHPMG